MANRNSLTAGTRAAALFLAFSWLAAGQSPSPAGRLETLKTKGLDAEVMVLPVRLGDRTMSEVGEVVAVFLEHGGMRKVDWTTQAFSRPGEATFQEMSTAFGDYVRGSAITTEYTLYAEFLGTPGAGVAEIRGLLVDKGGNPVWSYRQTPEDEEFKKMRPREPMQCIFMLVNALREDVKRWRASGWENASETTKKLLRHWWREDRGRRLFFCQIEALAAAHEVVLVVSQPDKPAGRGKELAQPAVAADGGPELDLHGMAGAGINEDFLAVHAVAHGPAVAGQRHGGHGRRGHPD